ncbi:hypothetical protein [Cellulomonas denverensis]|uniref:Fumarate reductase subunit C n=1 Tax=Cellulomonas denverensis TaxID=264297 RepID=A0A7X6KTP0_9CELL|nr:hypothetical protein [Cellulomonas denverensis]NKY22052.1 hypothetical protein [Cellulomonas denverensis]GIG27209.1 hypothetical protein Cde04nite_34530 [Cellulomonas denverensis]
MSAPVTRRVPADPVAGRRRPYRAPVRRTWFLAKSEYRAYALREFSSVIVGLFVLDLMVGLVALHRGRDSWEWWVDLQTHPVNLVLTGLALVMAIVHATTWFQATPKIIRVRRGRRYVADRWVVLMHYLLLALFALVVVLWLGGL